MPYVEKYWRDRVDGPIKEILDVVDGNWGLLNYVLTRILWIVWEKNKSYSTGQSIVGLLECTKAEYLRRKLAEYEDGKIIENGDVTIDVKGEYK